MTKSPIEERFLATITGKSEDELKLMALKSQAVYFACCCMNRDKDNRTIHPVPNILQLRMASAAQS